MSPKPANTEALGFCKFVLGFQFASHSKFLFQNICFSKMFSVFFSVVCDVSLKLKSQLTLLRK